MSVGICTAIYNIHYSINFYLPRINARGVHMSSHNKRDLPGVESSGLLEKCIGIHTSGATQSGMGGMVYCLSKNRVICEYAVHFGDSHFCLHPNNTEESG